MLFVDFKYDNLADSTLKDERPIMFQLNLTGGLSTLNTALKAAMATKLDANGQPVREKVGGLTNPIFVHLSGGTLTVNVGNTTGTLAVYFNKSGINIRSRITKF